MKKSFKSFVAAGLAGVMSLTSTIGAFAANNTPVYELNETKHIVVNFIHGEYGTENFNAGYDFTAAGLTANGTGTISAANFVKMTALDDGLTTGAPALGAEGTGQIVYCLAPNQSIDGSTYITGHGYSTTVVETNEAGDYVLDVDTVSKLNLALTFGYTGQVKLRGEENSAFGRGAGHVEWTEYSFPHLIYKNSDGSYYNATEHRLATQIAIWLIVCGWDDNEKECNQALDIFTQNLPGSYPSHVKAITNKILSNVNSHFSTVKKIDTYFNNVKESAATGGEEYMKRFEDSNAIELYDIPDVVLDNCKGGSIIAALSYSLQKATGAKPGQYKITFINDNDIRIQVDEGIDISDWKPSIEVNFLEGNSAFDYVKSKGLISTTQQNGIVTQPPTYTWDGPPTEAPPSEGKLRKTFNGFDISEVNVDSGDFAFVIGINNENARKIRYFTFDLNDETGYYEYTDQVNTTAAATKLRISDDGYIYVKGFDNSLLEEGESFFMVETMAGAGWDAKAQSGEKLFFKVDADGSIIPEEGDGEVVFDNHGDGTGTLILDKKFFNSANVEVTAASEGEDLERYVEAIEGLTFTLYDGDGTIVPVTGNAGLYECLTVEYEDGQAGTADSLKLNADGRLIVTDLPAGTYKIVENLDAAEDCKIQTGALYQYEAMFQVGAISPETTIEDLLQTPAYNTITNVFKNIKINIEVNKDSDDGRRDGFMFSVTGSNGYTATGSTDENGYLVFEDLDVYDDNGDVITYTVEELETREDGTSSLRYIICDPQEVNAEEYVNDVDSTAVLDFFNFTNTSTIVVIKEAEDNNVEGIEFVITGSDGSEYTMKTDRNGYARFEFLPIYTEDGTELIEYTVTETVPKRYEDQNPQTVVLDEEKTQTEVKFYNVPKRSNYYIFKDSTDFVWEGFTFAIEGSDGSYMEAQSNAAGLVTFEDLLVYDENDNKIVYRVYEINTPDRYYTPEAVEDIELEEIEKATENVSYITNTEKLGSIKIHKVDADGNSLTGVSFALYAADEYDEGGAVAKDFKSADANGYVLFDEIPINKEFVIVEMYAPTGYAKTTEPYRFTITEADADNEYEVTYEWVNQKSRQIKLLKVDSVTQAPILGARFELYDPKGQLVTFRSTDIDGIATFKNLGFGTYKLVETAAASNYELPEDEADRTWEVEITENSPEIIEVTAENTPDEVPNSISVYKLDKETGKPLAGAVFELFSVAADGTRTSVDKQTSDKNGLAMFKDVEEGNYIIKEIAAPAGYKLVENELAVTVDYDIQTSYSFVVENELDETSPEITISKVDSKTGDALEGAEFTLFDASGTEDLEGPLTTDAEGKVTLKNIAYGETYVIRETKAPVAEDGNRYEASATDFTVTVLEGDTNAYKVTASADNDYVDAYGFLNDDGNFVSLSRLATEQNVLKTSNNLHLAVTWTNGTSIEKKYGDLVIEKTAEDNIIEGLSFVAIGNNKSYAGKTDADGKIYFKHLPVLDENGEKIVYTVYETNTPDRYLACPAQETELTEDDTVTLTFENKNVDDEVGAIRIIKTSEDDKVAGIVFTVTGSDGQSYQLKTNASGEAVLENLPIYDEDGDTIVYTVTEEEMKGYKVLAPVTIERLYEGAVIDAKFHNIPEDKVIRVRLDKIDTSRKPVIGATFGLYGDAGCSQFIQSAKTANSWTFDNGNGLVEVVEAKGVSFVYFTEGLTADTTYYLREIDAPEGYLVNDTIWECYIDEDGTAWYRVYGSGADFSTTSPTCVNTTEDDEPKEAKIIKTDGTDKLEGAVFGLYEDEACSVKLAQDTSKIDSDKNSDTYGKAVVSFEIDVDSIYYIKEISAPEGYVASETVYKAVVDDEGNVLYGIVGSDSFTSTFPVCVNKKTPTSTTPKVTTTPGGTMPPPVSTSKDTTTTTPVVTTPGTTPSGSRPPVVTTTPGNTTPPVVTTTPGDDTTTTPKYTTTPPEDTTPKYTTTTTTTTTTRPPVTTTTVDDEETPKTPKDDNPETGVSLNTAGLVALAVLSGIACAACVARGVTARKKESEDSEKTRC